MLTLPKYWWYVAIVGIIGGYLQHPLYHARPSCPLSSVQTEHHPIRDNAKVAVAEIVFWVSMKETVGHLDYGERSFSDWDAESRVAWEGRHLGRRGALYRCQYRV